jgi:hypothetical protein
MVSQCVTKQRVSILYPATINDLSFETMRDVFVYLKPEDLASLSNICRAWRPPLQDVQRSQTLIRMNTRERIYAQWLCGVQLTRVVFGSETFAIKNLAIDLNIVKKEYIPVLAGLIARALRTLEITFEFVVGSASYYEILNQFFSRCEGIRNLKLNRFRFGTDRSLISQTIKEGFYRLSELVLAGCDGNLQVFVERVKIPNLHSFSNDLAEGDIVTSFYPTIKRLRLIDDYATCASIFKYAYNLRDIEEFSFSENVVGLDREDLTDLSSLVHLQHLRLDCDISDEISEEDNKNAISTLTQFKGLRTLELHRGKFNLFDILPIIGKKLVSLTFKPTSPILETVDLIVDYCYNLQYLDVGWSDLETDENAVALDSLKDGLRKLVKLRFNGVNVRLGQSGKGVKVWLV